MLLHAFLTSSSNSPIHIQFIRSMFQQRNSQMIVFSSFSVETVCFSQPPPVLGQLMKFPVFCTDELTRYQATIHMCNKLMLYSYKNEELHHLSGLEQCLDLIINSTNEQEQAVINLAVCQTREKVQEQEIKKLSHTCELNSVHYEQHSRFPLELGMTHLSCLHLLPLP